MSTIGKIFVVLNLILAAVFVGFASTYLDKAANYKAMHTSEVEARKADVARLDAQLQDEITKAQGLDAKLAQATQSLARETTRNKELVDENERLDGQVSRLNASIETIKSDFGVVSSSIDRATGEYTSKVQLALEAMGQRDEAVRAKEAAVADLADARNQIAALQDDVESKQMMLAKLNDDIRDQKIILDIAAKRDPSILDPNYAVAKMSGTVQHVAGDLLTILVTDNPTGSDIVPGYRFAIAGNGTYKGDARVTEVEGNQAFCVMAVRADNASVKVGDAAMTQTF